MPSPITFSNLKTLLISPFRVLGLIAILFFSGDVLNLEPTTSNSNPTFTAKSLEQYVVISNLASIQQPVSDALLIEHSGSYLITSLQNFKPSKQSHDLAFGALFHLEVSSIRQYLFNFQQIRVRLRKSNLLFPFHSFW